MDAMNPSDRGRCPTGPALVQAPPARVVEPGEALSLILAATNDGIMDWDLVNETVQYSERWKALLGFETHELVDNTSLWRHLTHPADLAEVETLLRDHLDNVWPFSHRWRMRHKNGEWRWSLCRAITVRDESGVPLRFLGVFSDVTDQVLTEHGLANLTRQNELLLASAGEGFLGIDERATITFANPAAADLLGHPMTELVGRELSSVFGHGCPSERPCQPAACPILKPFHDGGVQRVANGTCHRSDGASFAVDYSSTPAREESRIVGVVLTFRDVTDQRRLEARRLQGQKLEAVGQLAAGIAHEINTPMQYIGDNVSFLEEAFQDISKLVDEYQGIIGALQDHPQTPELVQRATTAETAADLVFLRGAVPGAISATIKGVDRVRKIVNAMKEFSHPGTTEKAPANLNRAIESTLTISANTWRQTATVELALDPDLPLVSCYLGELNQVVLNLLVNAAHAIADAGAGTEGRPLGVIRIETGLKDGFAEIRISDTGGGIPEAIRHRIFEPFFTTKEIGRGTGQGLALAHSIAVDKHAGYLRFVTELGRGTTFTIGIPTG
jgi:PAS domain S-box-containing protein